MRVDAISKAIQDLLKEIIDNNVLLAGATLEDFRKKWVAGHPFGCFCGYARGSRTVTYFGTFF